MPGSFFSGLFDENQLLELAAFSVLVAVVAEALSKGFKKSVVLFQVFLVVLVILPQIDVLLVAGLGLLALVHEGHQLFFAPVVTPLAAGALEPPNQPSPAQLLPAVASNIMPDRATVIHPRNFICASPTKIETSFRLARDGVKKSRNCPVHFGCGNA